MTLHSAFDFKFGNEHKTLSNKKLAKFRENFKLLKILIIDEVSLLGADMLYRIHLRLCEIKQNEKPFGGISVILVGDLLQLAPVKAKYVFDTPQNEHFIPFHNENPLWQEFQPFILKHNHRQGDASLWTETLNRCREGIVTEDDELLLKGRLTTNEFLDEDAIHIFYTNFEVNQHNTKMLEKLETPLITIKAGKYGPKGYTAPVSKDGRIASTQFLDELSLKVNARCVLTWNVNTVDDLVNGSTGTIIAIERNRMSKDSSIYAIIVRFDDEGAGKIQRLKHPKISSRYKEVNGTPIFREELDYQISSKKGYSQAVTAKIKQFPIRINYASTAHRMQGQTVIAGCKVVIHWHRDMKQQKGMAYVMLGRTQRIDDIYISGHFDFKGLGCCSSALKESQRLSQVHLNRNDSNAISKDFFTISYLNVRSLKAHHEDIKKDNFLLKSDIISFGETWMNTGEEVLIDGFQGSFANDGRGKGVALFSKVSFLSEPYLDVKQNFSFASAKTENVQLIALYISQNCNQADLCQTLEEIIDKEKLCIIMGDVNWNYHSENNQMKRFLLEKGFEQLVEHATFDKGSLLDHVYVNRKSEGLKVDQTSVYYSDHDIITISLRK